MRKKFEVEKNPTSSVKIGGFGGQKRFSDFAETSLIIRSDIEKFANLAVL